MVIKKYEGKAKENEINPSLGTIKTVTLKKQLPI
jgi:hypothetical protein